MDVGRIPDQRVWICLKWSLKLFLSCCIAPQMALNCGSALTMHFISMSGGHIEGKERAMFELITFPALPALLEH